MRAKWEGQALQQAEHRHQEWWMSRVWVEVCVGGVASLTFKSMMSLELS